MLKFTIIQILEYVMYCFLEHVVHIDHLIMQIMCEQEFTVQWQETKTKKMK